MLGAAVACSIDIDQHPSAVQKRSSRQSTRARTPSVPNIPALRGPAATPSATLDPPSPFNSSPAPVHPNNSGTLLDGYSMRSLVPVMQTLLDLYADSDAARATGALTAADVTLVLQGYGPPRSPLALRSVPLCALLEQNE